jgi:F-type H+-transporting ATPase subunit delta
MPEVFHIRTRFEELWDVEMKLLPVEVTSAVELDEAIVRDIGERIGTQTGNKIELTSVVDPDISVESCSAWATSSSTHRLRTG